MAGDVSKRKETPTVTLNKLQMEAMMSEIMKRMKRTNLLQKKHADDFFGNVSQDQKVTKFKRRSRIPSFCGRNDHDGYLEWEQKMELVFDGQNYSESKKVRLATSKFCGDVIQWWDQLVTTRKRTGEAQVASWFELKHFMKKHFVSSNYSRKQPRQPKEETRTCHDHDHPRKSQSHKQRKPDPRPPSRASEPLCSKKKSAIKELKTESSKVSKELETENEFSLFSSQSELVISSACDELTCFEPVQPSSIDSVSQVLEENPSEEAQKSSPPEVLEQTNNIEAETDAKSFSLNSQEH